MTAKAVVLRICAALLLLLTACAPGSNTTQTKQAAAFPTGPITIVVWDTLDVVKNGLVTNTYVPGYQKLHPNVTIDYQPIPGGTLLTKILAGVTGGDGPAIMAIQDSYIPTLAPRGVLAPAEDQDFTGGVKGIIDSYIPGLIDVQQYNGKLYALPIQENAHSLFINNRMFAAAGLDPAKDAPKTWADVKRLNTLLTKTGAGGRITQKGFDWRLVSDQWGDQTFHLLDYQAGGIVLDSSENPLFNDSHGVQAMQTLLSAISSNPSVTSNTPSAPYMDFASEQDAMSYMGPNAGPVIETINPKMVGNYSVAPLPQIDPAHPAAMRYSVNYAVNAAKSPDETRVAWDFINYVLGDSVNFFKVVRMLQPHKDWYKTSAAQSLPGLDVFVHDLSIAKASARTRHNPELQAALTRAIQRILFNHQDIKASLDQAASEFKQAAGL